MPDDEQSVRKMLAGSDIALFFSAHDEDQELENALRYGVIPVAPQSATSITTIRCRKRQCVHV